MRCPSCKNENLTRADYDHAERGDKSSLARSGIQLDYCPDCRGIWFDKGELRKVKDKEDKFLSWVDIDPWKDKTKFKIAKSNKICPVCGVPFYAVKYDDFEVEIDLCNVCRGIWLDKEEFEKIIGYLKEKIAKETLLGYLKDIGEEFTEIFIGPEKLSSEIADFLIVMKLFEYRLLAKMPVISKIIARLPG